MLPSREPSGWMVVWVLGSLAMHVIALGVGVAVFRRSYTVNRGTPVALALGLGAGVGALLLGGILWTLLLGALFLGAYFVIGT